MLLSSLLKSLLFTSENFTCSARCWAGWRGMPITAGLASSSFTPASSSSSSSLLRHRDVRRSFLKTTSSSHQHHSSAVTKFFPFGKSENSVKMLNAAASSSEIKCNVSTLTSPTVDLTACNQPHKTISVMTLNCWGIPYVAKNRKERFCALTEALVQGSWDIVVLQEIWSENDFKKMVNDVESVYPSSYYFYSGVLGSGVCVFTKGQIVATLMHRYSLNGYAHKIQHGDWFGGKVCGLAKIVHHGFLINLYATHIHASYHEKHDEYKPHRIVQAFELSQFIRFTSSPSTLSLAEGVDENAVLSSQRNGGGERTTIDWLHPLTIVAGDFNMEASDLGFELIKRLGGLTDTWDSYKRHSIISKDTSNIHAETSECFDNYYTPQSTRQKLGQNSGKRIDYVLFGQPAGFETPYHVRCTHAAASLNKIPNSALCYSDHKGYVAELEIRQREIPASTPVSNGHHHHHNSANFSGNSSFMPNSNRALIDGVASCPNLDLRRRDSVAATTRSISHDAGGLNDELIERAIAIVEDGFRKVRRDSRFFIGFGFVVFAVFIGTFITAGFVDIQLGMHIAFAIARVLLIGILIACSWIVLVMARIERNALRATRNTMMLMQGNMNPETKSIDDDSVLGLQILINNKSSDSSSEDGGLKAVRNAAGTGRSFSSSRLLSQNSTQTTASSTTVTTTTGAKKKLQRHRSSGNNPTVKV